MTRVLQTLLVREWFLYVAVGSIVAPDMPAQIPQPDDAPAPLSVDEGIAGFRLPPGYRIDLVASEPLVREPSGVWDEHGRLYVCELHGYRQLPCR